VTQLNLLVTNSLGKFERTGRQAETSRNAAIAIFQTSGTKRAIVYRAIRESTNGLTDEEIQCRLEMNPSTQRPRRVELVDLGVIRDSGLRRTTKSGRAAVVWIAEESAA
jgi:hypothetical protein